LDPDPEPKRNFTITVFGGSGYPGESEDCLYLNVYAPTNGGTGKAVMFWIYGGGLEFGTAGQISYDGSSFATNQDVVVVSANYRTNGNLASPLPSKLKIWAS
jgi:carboxylesterase type B